MTSLRVVRVGDGGAGPHTAESPRNAPEDKHERDERRWRRLLVALLVLGLPLAGQTVLLVTHGNLFATDSGRVAATLPARTPLSQRLNSILSAALGPSDRGARRFRITSIRPQGGSGRRVVAITWAINNDLSAGTLGNGAAVDAYLMLRGIYSSHLPVANIRLTGTYALPSARGHTTEKPVMRLALDRRVANVISEAGWAAIDEQSLWPLLRRDYVDPVFRPLSGE